MPGPNEELEAERMPYETMKVEHPCDPIHLTSYDNDWLVENFTPRLREFVLEHFKEDLITEPKYVASIQKFVGPRFYQASGSFVSVFMRPQTAVGSDPNATMPVHYNIAKCDVINFQRKVQGCIERCQHHLELFAATMRGLKALLQKGMSESEHINVMLPHSYQAFDEVEGMMLEAERPLFPKLEGNSPAVIVDTSGPVGKHLPYVKGALKRMLYAHMSNKVSFQLVGFGALNGEPRLWQKAMAPPTEPAMQAAEDWIDSLQRVEAPGNLLNAVSAALSQACDSIYILSSAELDKVLHEQVLVGIRSINVREVPISAVAVEPQPHSELLLRNIAESNHGDFSLKSFDSDAARAMCSQDQRWTSWRTNLVNEKSKQLTDSFKKQRMSIGSQIKIIEVMARE